MNTVAPVEIELDRTRHLTLTFGAAKRFRDVTGKSVGNIDQLDTEDISTLIWVCLLKDDPTLTLEAVDEMLEIPNTQYYVECLGAMFTVFSPKTEDADPNPESPTG